VVERVHDTDSDLLRYLDSLGLRPPAKVHVENYIPFDRTLHVKINEQPDVIVLGPRITREVFVELEN
jgi:Fe2+ transport system protein FeoA